MTVHHSGELPTSTRELLLLIDKETPHDDAYLMVTGPVPQNSELGVMIRLGWLARTVRCSPDCWNVHCPTPEIHKNAFRFTTQGRTACDRIKGRITRGGDRHDGL